MFQKLKQNFWDKALIAIWLYIGLLVVGIIVLYVYLHFESPMNEWSEIDLTLVITTALIYGVFGIFGLMDSYVVFFFPFLPLILFYGAMYLTAHFLYNPGNPNRVKKWLIKFDIILLASVVAVFIGMQTFFGMLILRDNRRYWNAYGTKEKVDVLFEFIKPTYDDKIVILNNGSSKVLYDYPNKDNVVLRYISPRGSYFVNNYNTDNTYENRAIEITHTHSR